MRSSLRLATLLLAAGCAATQETVADRGPVLSAELIPFKASVSAFADSKDPAPRTFRVEPAADGRSARLVLEVPGRAAREMQATLHEGGVHFSAGIGSGTELIRFGAAPGESWQSGDQRVVFEGWERLNFSNASYDAARISSRTQQAIEVPEVQTWWFAPRVGLVRLKNDHGTLFVDELVRTSP